MGTINTDQNDRMEGQGTLTLNLSTTISNMKLMTISNEESEIKYIEKDRKLSQSSISNSKIFGNAHAPMKNPFMTHEASKESYAEIESMIKMMKIRGSKVENKICERVADIDRNQLSSFLRERSIKSKQFHKQKFSVKRLQGRQSHLIPFRNDLIMSNQEAEEKGEEIINRAYAFIKKIRIKK